MRSWNYTSGTKLTGWDEVHIPLPGRKTSHHLFFILSFRICFEKRSRNGRFTKTGLGQAHGIPDQQERFFRLFSSAGLSTDIIQKNLTAVRYGWGGNPCCPGAPHKPTSY
jgi:hypothetical protein